MGTCTINMPCVQYVLVVLYTIRKHRCITGKLKNNNKIKLIKNKKNKKKLVHHSKRNYFLEWNVCDNSR
jgi:hypothetical protein